MTFIEQLELELNINKNPEMARPMEEYMKHNFSFLGIKAEPRRAIMKKCCEQHKQEVATNFRTICQNLFIKKEREYHLIAIDIMMKEIKNNYIIDDIYLIEKMLVTNSWWDSVDVLAKYLVGGYLNKYPEEKLKIIDHFSSAESMWLNRTAILFQLSYKTKTDFNLLKSECEKHKKSNEFFIQKAIGWALREYSKYNPKGVLDFVSIANLKPLSAREAIRNIK